MVCCGRTDVGKKRTVNQDSYVCESFSNGMQLAVVCDGMGGAAGGGIASNIACSVFSESMSQFAQSFGMRETLMHEDERAVKIANAPIRKSRSAGRVPRVWQHWRTAMCCLQSM